MRNLEIKRVHISGFGPWVDYSIDFSEHSFVAIYGENESGKSTLQRFILFMLFGLPPKARQFYYPKMSSKMGGRLVLDDDHLGEIIIERFDHVNQGKAKCYDQHGNIYDELWLTKQLKGMTEETVRAIFSFSAIDLLAFKQMKANDLDELLLSVGLTGSHRVYEVEKKLSNVLGELFKPYGKVPLLNQQLQLLEQLDEESRKLFSQVQTYQTYQEKSDMLQHEVAILEKKLETCRSELAWIERKQYALPLIEEERHIAQQLNEFPKHIEFPEDGIDRLQNIKDKLVPLKSELAIVQSSMEEKKQKLQEIQALQLSIQFIEEAKEWLKKKEQLIKEEQKLASYQESKQQLVMIYQAKIAELDLNIDDATIKQLRLPFHKEKHWLELRKRYEQLKFEHDQNQQDLQLLEKQKQILWSQMEDLKAALLDDDTVQELQKQIEDYQEFKLAEVLKKQAKQKQTDWQKARHTQHKRVLMMTVSQLLLAVILTIMAYLFEYQWGYIVACFMLVLGVGQWFWHRQSVVQTERLFTTDIFQPERSQSLTEQEIRHIKQKLEKDVQTRQKLATLESESHALESKLVSHREKNWQLQHREEKLNEEIYQEMNTYPFLKQMSVTHWSDLYHHIQELVQLRQQLDSLHEKIKQLREFKQQFHQQLQQFMAHKLGNEIDRDISIETCFETLAVIIAEQTKLIQQEEQLKTQMIQEQEKATSLLEMIQVYEQEISALFSIAEVDTEEAYYQKAKVYQLKQTLDQQYQSITRQLTSLFSESELEKLSQERLIKQELTLAYEQTKQKIKDMEQALADQRQALADVKAMITSLESSEAYSDKLHEIEIERAEGQRLAKKWAVYKVAQEILNKTKRQYRKKYLTKIMDKTSYFFRLITDGQYKEVLPPTENRGFQLLSHDDVLFDVNELSQGTVDQLYISLRLAVSQVMNEQNRFPLLIDDAFVHSDMARMKRIIKILSKLSEQQQVILWTCKPYIIDNITDAKIIQLESQSVSLRSH